MTAMIRRLAPILLAPLSASARRVMGIPLKGIKDGRGSTVKLAQESSTAMAGESVWSRVEIGFAGNNVIRLLPF